MTFNLNTKCIISHFECQPQALNDAELSKCLGEFVILFLKTIVSVICIINQEQE